MAETPIDAKFLRKAEPIVHGYRLIVKPHEQMRFVGSALEMPTVFGSGRTATECVESTYRALTVAVASMLEAGVAPPKASTQIGRREQMNIRLDPEEKLILQEAAVHRGFRSISDYVRAVALGDARKTA